ncbi:MAG: hypothetical protein NC111_00070 [Bacteroides sp.]|nr:hypothetical protein [Bacteroides sp.]MCM1412794.1 hypothetical protein [Bacteroides sp.]MCM1470912.1 hypothetical protein [Bacteroides sp.]
MNEINQIRTLLDAFYSGTITLEQTHQLETLLLTASHLPADLETDKEVILSLASSRNADIDIPVELDSMVSSTLDRCTSRPRWFVTLKWAAIAAAIVVAITLTATFLLQNDPADIAPKDQLPDLTAGNIDKTPAVSAEATIATQTIDEPQPSADETPSVHNQNSVPSLAKPSRTANRQSNFVVVTDPKEAERYTQLALNTLAQSMATADESHKKLRSTVDNIKSNIDNTLKQIQL